MAYVLSLKTSTWFKDSHSLFDYQSNKITEASCDLPLSEKQFCIFRKKSSNTITITSKPETVDREAFDLLSYIKIKPGHNANAFRLEFSDSKQVRKKNKKTDRVNTDESNSSSETKEETYIVVSHLKDAHSNPLGYKLHVGNVVKLGRVQYFVSEICFGEDKKYSQSKTKMTTFNRNPMKFNPQFDRKEINCCKICLDEIESRDNFLFNPCKCSGSCGTVHIKCLQHWIQIKVKKQIIGGTTHFNYEKFECEVCKAELPMVIETNDANIQLLPIEKPKGNYMILEAACQKSKSVMLIQNPGQDGIKIGRGHECEIRLNDISVSRNHAFIKQNLDGFYIFDNKSKFGTLLRHENTFELEIGQLERAIQIGRTLVQVQIRKKTGY